MSLGFESLDFGMVFANELSPMAAETFAYNHLKSDLRGGVSSAASNVRWISPQSDSLVERLSHNPYEASQWSPSLESDLPLADAIDDGTLIVGDVSQLNRFLEYRLQHTDRPPFDGPLDLVSGGPPCQSFSMAGLRQVTNARNRLPWEFAKFVSLAQPRVALLENVSGILRPFTINGVQFLAWKEVAKAFVEVGYVPICLHVNAKFVGVPQNRPRFLMFALRKDVADGLLETSFSSAEHKALEMGLRAFEGEWLNFAYFDAASEDDRELFETDLFRPLFCNRNSDSWVDVASAIGDLAGQEVSGYVRDLHEIFGPASSDTEVKNHDKRKHSYKVKQRFRVLQVLARLGDAKLERAVNRAIRHGDNADVSAFYHLVESEKFLFSDGLRKPSSLDEFGDLLTSLRSKKQSQRALTGHLPAKTALSIPDDYCHYDENELRTLSVREMARIQSFPDWFEFRSKVTTGGMLRRFEVPQYTQVGNAVPPLLARQAGQVVGRILARHDEALELSVQDDLVNSR